MRRSEVGSALGLVVLPFSIYLYLPQLYPFRLATLEKAAVFTLQSALSFFLSRVARSLLSLSAAILCRRWRNELSASLNGAAQAPLSPSPSPAIALRRASSSHQPLGSSQSHRLSPTPQDIRQSRFKGSLGGLQAVEPVDAALSLSNVQVVCVFKGVLNCVHAASPTPALSDDDELPFEDCLEEFPTARCGIALPPELVEEVLRWTQTDFECREDLRRFSLVSRAWAPPARRILFGQTLSIADEDSVRRLRAALDSSPELASHVRRIDLSNTSCTWRYQNMHDVFRRAAGIIRQTVGLKEISLLQIPLSPRVPPAAPMQTRHVRS